MGGSGNHVKQLLASARLSQRPELLEDVVTELHALEGQSNTPTAELRVLCAEVAVELRQWPLASELLQGVGAAHETRVLRIRRTLCDVLVSVHSVDARDTLAEEEKAQEKLAAAAQALLALTEGVEMWPDSADVVLRGVQTLWSIISPLLDAGREAEVCDAVVFLTTLHQQLHIGGGYTLIQWSVRSLRCLYAAERVVEAFIHLSIALEAAVSLANQRLYVQLLRMAAGVVCAKEKAAMSAKSKTEFLGAYKSRPAVYATLLTQLIFHRLVEIESSKDELHSVYEALVGGNTAEVPSAGAGGMDAASSATAAVTAAAATASKNKKKVSPAKQPTTVRGTEAFTVTEADVLNEVRSDVLLCLALHANLTPQQEADLEKSRNSSNRRVRSFTAYALLAQEVRRCGLTRLSQCADASSLTSEHQAQMQAVTLQLLAVLKNTNAIPDEAERHFTLHVGASMLWNCVLPFLQGNAAVDVQPALDTILDISESAGPSLRKLFLQAGLQECHIAYEEDKRHLLHRLLPALQLESTRGPAHGVSENIAFPVQWLWHQLSVLDAPESTLTNEQDRCLFAMEQARTVANPRKRIPLLKTAFQHLPPLLQETDIGAASPPDMQRGDKKTKKESLKQRQQQLVDRGVANTVNSTIKLGRRSTLQLYKELLDLCMEELSPSLYAVAGAVAEALRSLPGPPPGASAEDTEEIQAAACLHSVTLLCKQVEDDGDASNTTAKPFGMRASTPSLCAESLEDELAALLLETARRGSDVEMRRNGAGAWIVANACMTFLNWKKPAHVVGDYSAHMSELMRLQETYKTLFVKGRVQDVALLSDLTVAAVVGLLVGYANTKADAATPSRAAASVAATSYGELVRRLQTCPHVEPANQHLRKAEAVCREVLQLLPAPRHKWFVAMLHPCTLRLLNEKPAGTTVLHPQEQLLWHLGTLATSASMTKTERQTLLDQDMRALLRKDPSVRLCAWVATWAAEMRQEETLLECCQLADRLYASGRLGWDSLYEVMRPAGGGAAVPGNNAGASPNNNNTSSGNGGGSSSTHNHKSGSHQPVLVLLDTVAPAKPDPEDWSAYAQLLSMKTQVCANQLLGLTGGIRRTALQQLLVNCVNTAIAAMHGTPAERVRYIAYAYSAYYDVLRGDTAPLSEAAFILPSLRMLLSKALLSQIPKREWSDYLTELVYHLSCILVHVSYSGGKSDDICQLGAHVRVLKEFLPPRCQKSLRMQETTEACHQNPSVESFLKASQNMETEVQTRGWLIVAQNAKNINSNDASEALALALAGTTKNAFARAQCLFEHANAAFSQHGAQTWTQTTEQLREALRVLEGLPESVPLVQVGEKQRQANAALADKSVTATFLRAAAAAAAADVASQSRGDARQQEEVSVTTVVRTTAKTSRTAIATRKAAAAGLSKRQPGLSFQHVFLGLRIVSLLFRVSTDGASTTSVATGTGAAAAKAARDVAPASRRDCADVMLDYVHSLWLLCATFLRDDDGTAASQQQGAKDDGQAGAAADTEKKSFYLPPDLAQCDDFAEPAAGAAQRLRRNVPDEELQLNTEGLWRALLGLGDYLVRRGDEANAFTVYRWVRFAAVVALGEAAKDAQSAVVQRVCYLKMCVAAAASGRSDDVHVTALRLLEETQLTLREDVRVGMHGGISPAQWVLHFIEAECETRVLLGQVETAAVLAAKYLAPAPSLCTGSDISSADIANSTEHTDSMPDGRRYAALHAIVCTRPTEALRLLDSHLVSMPPHHDPHQLGPALSLTTRMRLSTDKLIALLSAHRFQEALQWVTTIHQQLQEWNATAATAPTAATSKLLRMACLRADLAEAAELWAKELLIQATQLQPSSVVSEILPGTAAVLHAAATALLQEVLHVSESVAFTLHVQLYSIAARWQLRDRVTSQWIAEHAHSVNERLCPRLTVLLAELKTVEVFSRRLQDAIPRSSGIAAAGAGVEASAAPPTSLIYWQACLHYWSAIDRLEVNRLLDCLLIHFRRLSMADLNLPTSDAPAHLEAEVLKFIRGAPASNPTDVPTKLLDNEVAVEDLNRDKVSVRWSNTSAAKQREVEQALCYYKVPVEDGLAVTDLCRVVVLLRQAAVEVHPWRHTRLAGAIWIALTEVEVRRQAEARIPFTEHALGLALDSEVEAILTAAWNRTPLTEVRTERSGSRVQKGTANGKHRSSSVASQTSCTASLSREDRELLQHILLAAREAMRGGHLDLSQELFDRLSHLAMLLNRPQRAAAAAEQVQACQLIGLLFWKCAREMADCPEGRRWRRYRSVDPLLRGSTFCRAICEEALTSSPMERALRSCTLLCIEKEKEEEMAARHTSTPRGSNLDFGESSSFVIDAPVLTIAATPQHGAGVCTVTLRHPDGNVDTRRYQVPASTWKTLAHQLDHLQRQKEVQLTTVAATSTRAGSVGQRVTAEEAAAAFEALSIVANTLLEQFQASLQFYCSKVPLYLCVAPALQAFTWEQTTILSAYPVTLRELAASVVVAKAMEPGRAMKRASVHGTKGWSPGSGKGVPVGPPVCFFDLFGDYTDSTEALVFSTESTKAKSVQLSMATCKAPGTAPDPSYLAWLLNASGPGALVVDMCGNLSDALPWSHLAMLRLSALQVVVLADGAVNSNYRQRQERQGLSTGSLFHLDGHGEGHDACDAPPRWMVQLVLLLRGAKCVAASAFPCTPAVADSLIRRCLTSLSSGRALVDQLKAKSKDAATPLVTLYGTIASTTKQKA